MKVEPNRNVYVGHRYVPKIFGEWDNSNEYEGLSIVTHKGNSYTSKKRVPVGIDISNDDFWVITGNYNAQVEYYRDEVERYRDYSKNKIDEHWDNIRNDFNDHKKEVSENVNEEVKRLDNNDKLFKNRLDDISVNVKDFGALGDGNRDDTVSIQQAVNHVVSNGGGRVYIPSGIYRVSSTITLDSNIEFYGAGSKLTTLKPDFLGDNEFQNIIIIQGFENTRKENVTLHNFGIDGSNVELYETESRGMSVGEWARIQPRNVDNFKAYDLHYYSGSHLFHMHGCHDFIIDRINTDYSFSAVHLVSTNNENIGGSISNIVGTRMACMIDFGGGGQNIVVSNIVGNGLDNFRENEEAFDIGGSKNIKITNSILSNFRNGIELKGESDKIWDEIHISNTLFEGFTNRGMSVSPGGVRPFERSTGTLRMDNVQFVSDRVDNSNTNPGGLNIRETFGFFHLNNITVKVNTDGVYFRGFEYLNIKNIDINSEGYGILFEALDIFTQKYTIIDGITINNNKNRDIFNFIGGYNLSLKNFFLTNSDNVSIFIRNVDNIKISDGIIKDTYGGGISLYYQENNIKEINSKNVINTVLTNIDIVNWGIDSNYSTGINFNVPSVNGTFKGLLFNAIKFTQDIDPMNKTGISWNPFGENNIDHSIIDNLIFNNITVEESFPSNKGENIIGKSIII